MKQKSFESCSERYYTNLWTLEFLFISSLESEFEPAQPTHLVSNLKLIAHSVKIGWSLR